MENKTKYAITHIERIINGVLTERCPIVLTEEQRETLTKFDRFNELEEHSSYGTRKGYMSTLYGLGKVVKKPYETMSREDLQTYISELSKDHAEGTIATRLANIKRFFTWLEWVKYHTL